MTTATENKSTLKNKGGRPHKAIKRDKMLGVKCTAVERFTITHKAKQCGLTVSEYLRGLGLNGKVDRRKIPLNKEILQFTGTLNHLAANMNQTAKKRNQNDELNAIERASLQQLASQVKQLALDIKNCLK